MSFVSNVLQGGDVAGGSTELLSAILNEIGASQFLQKLVDDDQEDESIPLLSKMKPERIASKYGLPHHLASAFLKKCRENAGARPSSFFSSTTDVLSALLRDVGALEFIQKFTDDYHRDDSIPLLSRHMPEQISSKYGLPSELAAAFTDRCRSAIGARRSVAASTNDFTITSSSISSAASPVNDASLLLELKLDMVGQLGKGGFGTVYKCKDPVQKRFVAVKLVSDTKNAKNAQAAICEGQKLLRAKHSNIVSMYRVHDLSPVIGSACCALEMEVVAGGDLSDHLEAARRRPEQRLPAATVLRFSRQLLQALAYLHDDMKLIHGDIKPPNMLLQSQPLPADGSAIDYSEAEVKLADFGLAKAINQEHLSMSLRLINETTKVGEVKGTTWYLSPEALQGAATGYERTYSDDLWSACLVMLEMDTGAPLQQLMTAPGAVKLEELLTKTSRALLPPLASVLAVPDAASRCKSAAELLQKLDASSDPLYIWEEYDATAGKYTCMHPAASFVLETAFLANEPLAQMPLQPPLDLNFDIKALLSSATALGSATERRSGAQRAIRRLLKPSALTSSCEIPIWQQLVDGKEWLTCSPAICAKLEIDSRNVNATIDVARYRRVTMKSGTIGDVQLPHAMKSEPYLAPARADDVAVLSKRVHESLPEWDITDMVQVINPTLASKYAAYRHRVAARCNGDPNERMLFHFPHPSSMTKIWQEGEGHDPRLSQWAEVGKGAYFSEHIIYGYAYKFCLFPSPPDHDVKPEPSIGQNMQVFASLVCLGNVADMGPGCESCPSLAWQAWKKETSNLPKPTRPPAMSLPSDAAHKQHMLDLMQVKDAPRCDSVSSTEGDLATNPESTNRTASGQPVCDIMHPRLRARAHEWAKQFIVFETAASYPMFIITVTKTRESPMGPQQLMDSGCDAARIKSLGFRARDVVSLGTAVQYMRSVGWPLDDLKAAGVDAGSLIAGGYSLLELKTVKFSALQLKNACCSAQQLKDAGFTALDLMAAQFNLQSLILGGYSVVELKNAGFTAFDVKSLGTSAQDMRAAGWLPVDMKAAGFDVESLVAGGYSVAQMKSAGFTVSQLCLAGCSVQQLKEFHVHVVAGHSGSGKSHWCFAKGRHLNIELKCWLHIVVHEGFSVLHVMDRYRTALAAQDFPARIGFHFDVSEHADLRRLGAILHDLFSSGFIADSSTGNALELLSGIEHFVFIELPALQDDAFHLSCRSKWPGDTVIFHASQHPFLSHLPAVVAVSDVLFKTLSNRQSEHHTHYPLFSNYQTNYVARCLEFVSGEPLNPHLPLFHEHSEKSSENLDPDSPPDDHRIRADRTIHDAFSRLAVQHDRPVSKRTLWSFVCLLFERCIYLYKMQVYTSNFEPVTRYLHDQFSCANFLAHFWVHSSQDILKSAKWDKLVRTPLPDPYPYIPNFYAKILRHCMNESAFLAQTHLFSWNEPQVWVLRCPDYNRLQLLVSLPQEGMQPHIYESEMKKLELEDFMKKRIIEIISIEECKYRRWWWSNIFAPYLKLDCRQFVTDAQIGHLTAAPDFWFTLLLFQGRRSCRSSLVLSGDTVVGKSMMLNLYSLLINGDSAISIDWHSQFVKIVRGLALICVDDPFVRETFFVSVDGRDIKVLGELYDAEYQRALAQCAPVAAQDEVAHQSHQHQLRAVAAAKMIIADYKKTHRLILVSDTHNENAARFATCEAAVAALFDVGSDDRLDPAEESKRALKEHTLELFSDSLSFYFNCLVESMPLIKRGLSPFCSALFARAKTILRLGSARRRNAERVCKITTCLYDTSVDSCGNRAFSQNWTGFKDLNVDDFVIEPVVDVQGERAAAALTHAAREESDEVHSSGGDREESDEVHSSGGDVGPRPPIFRKNTDFRDFIESLVQTRPFGLCHRILAHDGLDCTEWRSRINAIKNDAAETVKLCPTAVSCVFVDEMNTANALGLINEAFSNHSMDGEPLPASLFFIGAVTRQSTRCSFTPHARWPDTPSSRSVAPGALE